MTTLQNQVQYQPSPSAYVIVDEGALQSVATCIANKFEDKIAELNGMFYFKDLDRYHRSVSFDDHIDNKHKESSKMGVTEDHATPTVVDFLVHDQSQTISNAMGYEHSPQVEESREQMDIQKPEAKDNQAETPCADYNKSSTVITTVGRYDIIRGRPGGTWNHPANRFFWDIFLPRWSYRYSGLLRNNKKNCSMEMLGELESDGFRFVKAIKGSRAFEVITDDKTKIEMIMHSLRDGLRKKKLPGIKNSSPA